MNDEQPELNKDIVINSLTNQIASLSLTSAKLDSVIATQQEQIQKLQQELGQLKTEEKAKGGKKNENN